mmetsp:Transcript_39482/g.85973  ORF Transcript_39482/g.85973 Transcript_39482/m.85973 type:complete len:314 (-) Transcript_39482:490-1431(-)
MILDELIGEHGELAALRDHAAGVEDVVEAPLGPRRLAARHLQHAAPQGPDVHRGGQDAAPPEELRRHPEDGAHDGLLALLPGGLAREPPRAPEVRDLHVAALREEEVGALEIAVDHGRRLEVQVAEALDELPHVLPQQRHGQGAVGPELRRQAAAAAELQEEVDALGAALLAGHAPGADDELVAEVADDALVLQLLAHPELPRQAHEPGGPVLIRPAGAVDEHLLHRHEPAGALVPGREDAAVAAVPQHLAPREVSRQSWRLILRQGLLCLAFVHRCCGAGASSHGERGGEALAQASRGSALHAGLGAEIWWS